MLVKVVQVRTLLLEVALSKFQLAVRCLQLPNALLQVRARIVSFFELTRLSFDLQTLVVEFVLHLTELLTTSVEIFPLPRHLTL